MPTYSSPVAGLLNRVECNFGEIWPNYVEEVGLRPEDVPELIRMVGDAQLYEEGNDNEYWATIHARRALGQLRAVEAVGPLLTAMDRFSELDDYWLEELPAVLALIGPPAIPAIGDHLLSRRPDEYTRIAAASALAKIGNAFPESRGECVDYLTRQLAQKEDDEDSWSLNGFVAWDLVKLKAVESATVIEEAFAADVVDESIAGGWPSLRYELGLGPEPKGETIRPQWRLVLDRPPKRPNLDKLRKKKNAAKKARKRGRTSR
ncbi:MAG: lyase HEAT-like repeat protein [Planctomycetota bacterium]|nr:lyase HEAT-like repeat protein [Planctomycetota bacterium]